MTEPQSLLADCFSDDWAERSRLAREDERLRDVLAQSTAADVKDLRLALARIIAKEHGTRSYGGGCGCAEGRGCSGHIPETTKIARAALGLPELPDRERVPLPPQPPRERTESQLVLAVKHVLRHGRLGKQSKKRLRAALAAERDAG